MLDEKAHGVHRVMMGAQRGDVDILDRDNLARRDIAKACQRGERAQLRGTMARAVDGNVKFLDQLPEPAAVILVLMRDHDAVEIGRTQGAFFELRLDAPRANAHINEKTAAGRADERGITLAATGQYLDMYHANKAFIERSYEATRSWAGD